MLPADALALEFAGTYHAHAGAACSRSGAAPEPSCGRAHRHAGNGAGGRGRGQPSRRSTKRDCGCSCRHHRRRLEHRPRRRRPRPYRAGDCRLPGRGPVGPGRGQQPAAAARFEQAAGQGEPGDFAGVLGASGGGMRLLALYDADRFDLIDHYELDAINTTGNVRAPLVLHLRETLSGREFLFMVNHLYRSKDAERARQAQLLNAWAATQTLPVIAVGDYNFDWSLTNGAADHDVGYDLMTAGGVWEWVQPASLVTTQCSGWPCAYDSVLDFVFMAGPARDWRAESEIVVAAGDFPDDATTSDHRPVVARFVPQEMGSTAAADASAPPGPAPAEDTSHGHSYGGTAAGDPDGRLHRQPGRQPARRSRHQFPGCGRRDCGRGCGSRRAQRRRRLAEALGRDVDRCLPRRWRPPGPGHRRGSAAAGRPTVEEWANVAAAPVEPPTATPAATVCAGACRAAEQSDCDPSYPYREIPSPPPDLDCGEIPYRRFSVVGSDPHRFDGIMTALDARVGDADLALPHSV